MARTAIERVMNDGRALILSFDQGLEEGPKAFNLHSIDPAYVLNIAREGQYTAIAVQPGIAEHYASIEYRDLPLIVKLNGKTSMQQVNPLARQYCSVEHAIKLGAEAVGYTLYDGSPSESVMFQEFGRIVEEAHDYGVPVIAWMYPRNGKVMSTDDAAYAARVALELGADAVKLPYSGDKHGFDWVVRSAGKMRVFMADVGFASDEELLRHVQDALLAGSSGIALGQTVWQHPKPFSLTRALHAVIFKNKSAKEALSYLQ